jgi:hypothetical protein
MKPFQQQGFGSWQQFVDEAAKDHLNASHTILATTNVNWKSIQLHRQNAATCRFAVRTRIVFYQNAG